MPFFMRAPGNGDISGPGWCASDKQLRNTGVNASCSKTIAPTNKTRAVNKRPVKRRRLEMPMMLKVSSSFPCCQ